MSEAYKIVVDEMFVGNNCFICDSNNTGITYAKSLRHISCYGCGCKVLSGYNNTNDKNEIIIKLGKFNIDIYNNTVSVMGVDDEELEVFRFSEFEAAVARAKELCDKYLNLEIYV